MVGCTGHTLHIVADIVYIGYIVYIVYIGYIVNIAHLVYIVYIAYITYIVCIEEKEDDIIVIWCCQRYRKLPELTSVLCTKIDALQKDMSFLLNFVNSFSVPTPKPAVPVDLDLSDNTPECNDRTVSLVQSMQIQQDLTISSDDSSTLPPHEGVDHNTSQSHNQDDPEVSCKLDQVDVSGKDPQMINTDTPEESTDGNPATGNRGTSHVKTRLRPAGLNRSRHDVYISGLHDETSNDDVRGFMYDIGVSDIVSIERVHDTLPLLLLSV